MGEGVTPRTKGPQKPTKNREETPGRQSPTPDTSHHAQWSKSGLPRSQAAMAFNLRSATHTGNLVVLRERSGGQPKRAANIEDLSPRRTGEETHHTLITWRHKVRHVQVQNMGLCPSQVSAEAGTDGKPTEPGGEETRPPEGCKLQVQWTQKGKGVTGTRMGTSWYRPGSQCH